MSFYVYILYSQKLDKHYIGISHDVQVRLKRHNGDYYENKWTKNGKPWELFFSIECSSKKQSILIERHIKSMKSSKYLHNLKSYPEMVQNLFERFGEC